MQYETIILELLSRIKKLEEDVEELKSIRSNDEIEQETEIPSASYTKITSEMIEKCYKCGKRVLKGEELYTLAGEVSSETGMNRSSAFINIYVVSCMLTGEVYKRAVSRKALEIYFQEIYSEYGNTGLRKAINATRLHIDYRKSCGHIVNVSEDVCARAEAKLQ